MIYFAQVGSGGPIKIGYSQNVDARLRQLESRCLGLPFFLLATLPGGKIEEREIHQKFSPYRYGRSEFFLPNCDIIRFITDPSSGCECTFLGWKRKKEMERKFEQHRRLVSASR
jgi:hypothetical protein